MGNRVLKLVLAELPLSGAIGLEDRLGGHRLAHGEQAHAARGAAVSLLQYRDPVPNFVERLCNTGHDLRPVVLRRANVAKG